MSEDQGLNRNQKKEEVWDFCGSLGKGMLAKEVMKSDQGLTPLHLSFDFPNRKSSDLTPLCPRGEPQMNADKRRYELSVPLSLRGDSEEGFK